jgi:phage terminase Nu1 subunit (DNA packaging protein)
MAVIAAQRLVSPVKREACRQVIKPYNDAVLLGLSRQHPADCADKKDRKDREKLRAQLRSAQMGGEAAGHQSFPDVRYSAQASHQPQPIPV